MKRLLRIIAVIGLTLLLCIVIWQLTLVIGLANAGSQPGKGIFINSLND